MQQQPNSAYNPIIAMAQETYTQPFAFIRVSSAHLLTLLDTIDEGIFAFDKEWHYLYGTTEAVMPGDAERLRQVFDNLISNAIKYSPQAQSVDIYLSRCADIVTVQVRDYGLGIPLAQRDRIFERFYRVSGENRKYLPGLGMGLYITREIVVQHGGTINVESQEGNGSIFSITLPILSG